MHLVRRTRTLAALALTALLAVGGATSASAAYDPIPPVQGTLPSISVGPFATQARCASIRTVYLADYSSVTTCRSYGAGKWYFSFRPASAR